MKKFVTLFLAFVLVSLLVPGQALATAGSPDQPQPAAPASLETQAQRVYLPLLAQTFPDRSLFGGEFASSSAGLTEIKDAGAYWARINQISWADVEPSPGVRDWSSLAGFEQMVMDMHARGMEVVAIIRETPSWAQAVPGIVCGPIKDQDIPAFANFVRDVVAKYSQGPYFIKHWEIENEPDVPVNSQTGVFGCWGDPSDTQYYGGRYYAKVIKQVYPAVKAADPQSQVLLGGLLMDCDPVNPPLVNGQTKDCTSSKYLEGVLVGGGGNYFDVVSFHAYDYYNHVPGSFGNINFGASEANHTTLTYKAAYLKSVLTKYGYGSKPLMNTEVALLCIGCLRLQLRIDQSLLRGQVVCRCDQGRAAGQYLVHGRPERLAQHFLDGCEWHPQPGHGGFRLRPRNDERCNQHQRYRPQRDRAWVRNSLTRSAGLAVVDGCRPILHDQFALRSERRLRYLRERHEQRPVPHGGLQAGLCSVQPINPTKL